MNLTISQNDKLTINGIKNIDEVDFHNGMYKSNNEKSVHLHGRKPLRIRFFANGDKYFPGKKISIYLHRYQNIDELMSELTNKMPPHVYLPNGIRQLFTTSGGRKIIEINQLEPGRDYVCAGNENFKNISYGKVEKEPWFKGRPHKFSRYPQLFPLGFGAQINNLDANNNNRIDDQSYYAGQNAFPTRFYRPTGQGYLNKNFIGQFVSNGLSTVFPKLVKFKSKATSNKNVNYYQDILNQQVKPRVITVVRSGPEKPKSFVRILLNKRSVQSYETLVSDIETSLRDHSHQKMRGIGKIFNLLGKEIKSVSDFFRNDDFFIAVGEHENLGIKQIKDILDDMYPDHPQTNQILKYWSNKKVDDASIKEDSQDQDKTKFISNFNLSVDKRDSGFEEQNFSKESEFNAPTTTEVTETLILPKPKLSKSKPSIKKKKNSSKDNQALSTTLKSVESENSIDNENISGKVSPATYQKLVQQRNSIRFQLAYEEREKARIQFQEQVKIERKKVENIQSSGNIYSQYIRKSIGDRGSIDVFKKMDEASQEARKQRMREKMAKSSQQATDNNNNVIPFHMMSSEVNSHDSKDSIELPVLETVTIIQKPQALQAVDSSNISSTKFKQTAYNTSPSVGKLNKINEDPAENVVDAERSNTKNEGLKKKEKIKKLKDLEKNRNRPQKLVQDDDAVNQEDKRIFDGTDSTNVVPKSVDSPKFPVEMNYEEDNTLRRKASDVNDKHEAIIQNVSSSAVVTQEDEKSGKQIISEVEIKRSSSVKEDKEDQLNLNKRNGKEEINNSVPHSVTQTVNSEQPVRLESKLLEEKPILEQPVQRKSSLPGSRVMGKLCRQLPSSEAINQRFDITKLLGDGNFAVVKLAAHKKTKVEYALKIIDKARMMGKESMIENEIWIMKLCDHENIVKLREEYETREEVFLVMELVKNGDLFDAITQNVKFSEPVAAKMVTDMANALFYLHSRRIVHRDLKPENLMVLRHKDGSITLKLADFGLAMEIKKLIYTVCGTPTYVAPEILSEKGYSLEVDLWALGVITYILLCGFPPFRSANRNQEELFQIIQSGNFEFISPYWDKISWEVKDLIRKLLVVDRKLRASTIDVLSHKWLMSRGKVTQITIESQKQKVMDLEDIAKENLESFQRQKKEFRAMINKEIQATYQNQKLGYLK